MFSPPAQPRVSPAPAAPTAQTVKPDVDAATTAALLAGNSSGFQSTMKTGGLGVSSGITSTAKLLGGTWA